MEEGGVILLGVLQPEPRLLAERQQVLSDSAAEGGRRLAVPERQHHRAHGSLQRLQRRLHAAVALMKEGPRIQALRLLPSCPQCKSTELPQFKFDSYAWHPACCMSHRLMPLLCMSSIDTASLTHQVSVSHGWTWNAHNALEEPHKEADAMTHILDWKGSLKAALTYAQACHPQLCFQIVIQPPPLQIQVMGPIPEVEALQPCAAHAHRIPMMLQLVHPEACAKIVVVSTNHFPTRYKRLSISHW